MLVFSIGYGRWFRATITTGFRPWAIEATMMGRLARGGKGIWVRKISMKRIFGFIGLVFAIAVAVVLLKHGIEVAFGIHIPAAVSGGVAGAIGASLLFWSERKR